MAASKTKRALEGARTTAPKSAAKSAANNAADNARRVLVTGGSRGLGLVIAQKLVAGGYHAITVARHESNEVGAAIAQAEKAGQGTLSFVPFDLGKIDDIPDLVRRLRKQFGPLYGLVNNAALGLSGALTLMRHTKIEEMVRLNTVSPIVLTKIRAARDDGRRCRTHRQCRLDRGLDRRQRHRRLCGDQGLDGRLHPLASPRGRSAQHHR